MGDGGGGMFYRPRILFFTNSAGGAREPQNLVKLSEILIQNTCSESKNVSLFDAL